MKIVGHRGSGFEYPENTIGGFLAAFGAGVRRFELDLRLTTDGVIVVHHDITTERTCNVNKAIRDMTSAEVMALNAAENSNVRFEPIPQLSQLLPLFEKCDHIELEIKKDTSQAAYFTICQQLNRMMTTCDLDKYYITSGHTEPLDCAAKFCPMIKRGFVFKNLEDADSGEVQYHKDLDLMVCDLEYTSRDAIKAFKQKTSMPLAVHGVSSIRAIQLVSNDGATYVITDIPQKAIQQFGKAS